MNIFSEVKEQLTTRQVAESYGLRIRKNGVACCPFHDDRHPSMKVDKNYHCFACGVGGDVIDYTARMYGLSQYDAAKKLIEDFGLHVQTEAMSREERQRLRREKEERMRIIQIKKRFYRWCEETIELLKDALVQIEDSGQVLYGKPPDVIFSEDYAMMLHAEPIINYYLKEHRSGIYQAMLLSGKLKEHLLMMQEQAEAQFDLLVKQMAEQEGVTEHLKEKNQMLWVQRMNNIRERAEEIVRATLLQ